MTAWRFLKYIWFPYFFKTKYELFQAKLPLNTKSRSELKFQFSENCSKRHWNQSKSFSSHENLPPWRRFKKEKYTTLQSKFLSNIRWIFTASNHHDLITFHVTYLYIAYLSNPPPSIHITSTTTSIRFPANLMSSLVITYLGRASPMQSPHSSSGVSHATASQLLLVCSILPPHNSCWCVPFCRLITLVGVSHLIASQILLACPISSPHN